MAEMWDVGRAFRVHILTAIVTVTLLFEPVDVGAEISRAVSAP